MADNKPDRAGAKAPPVVNRMKWFDEIMPDWEKYSSLQKAVAWRLAWTHFNRETNEIQVRLEKVAEKLRAKPRAVKQAYALLIKNGYLERISRASPDRAARYRLTQPATSAQQPEPKTVAPRAKVKNSPRKTSTAPPPTSFKNLNAYLAYLHQWLSREHDYKVIMARWSSDAEKKLRHPFTSDLGGSDGLLNGDSCRSLLNERLDQIPKPPPKAKRVGDDEIPF